MKKIIILMLLVLGIYGTVFPYESWLQAGFGYGNYFEKTDVENQTVETYIGSPGFDIGSFQFWDNFGFFIDLSFSFPNTVDVNVDGYNYTFQFGFMVGPAFKFNLTEHMKVKLGVGFSSLLTTGDYNNASLFNFNLGLGGDVGFLYTVNDLVYITIGTLAHYQFANRTNMPTPTPGSHDNHEENHEWAKNYSMIGIRPYIGIGFMIKPKDKS
jgi:hypothetical protein